MQLLLSLWSCLSQLMSSLCPCSSVPSATGCLGLDPTGAALFHCSLPAAAAVCWPYLPRAHGLCTQQIMNPAHPGISAAQIGFDRHQGHRWGFNTSVLESSGSSYAIFCSCPARAGAPRARCHVPVLWLWLCPWSRSVPSLVASPGWEGH